MTILELANQLKAIYDKHGNVTVMYTDPNSNSTFEVNSVAYRVAEEDEYPESWRMPEGFEFVELGN